MPLSQSISVEVPPFVQQVELCEIWQSICELVSKTALRPRFHTQHALLIRSLLSEFSLEKHLKEILSCLFESSDMIGQHVSFSEFSEFVIYCFKNIREKETKG